jgi:glycine cleavage system H lipoate-binding protein
LQREVRTVLLLLLCEQTADNPPFFHDTEEIGAVESVKAASDIFAPVGGQVDSVNSELEGSPDLLNKSAESEGAF